MTEPLIPVLPWACHWGQEMRKTSCPEEMSTGKSALSSRTWMERESHQQSWAHSAQSCKSPKRESGGWGALRMTREKSPTGELRSWGCCQSIFTAFLLLTLRIREATQQVCSPFQGERDPGSEGLRDIAKAELEHKSQSWSCVSIIIFFPPG